MGRFVSITRVSTAVSPLATLGRGYAVAWDERRTRVLRRASETAPGESVRVTLHEGEIRCDVREIIGPNGTDPKGSAP